jgi:hypothetical protein
LNIKKQEQDRRLAVLLILRIENKRESFLKAGRNHQNHQRIILSPKK